MQPKVFISYSHDDGFFVDRLKTEIEEWHITTWVDSESLRTGSDWRHDIDKAIQEAFTVIVVWSNSSKLSEYVIYEWAYALAHKIEIVVLKLKDIEIHARLNSYHQPFDFFNKDRTLLPWDRLRKCLEDNRQKYQEKPHPEVAQTFVDYILKLLRENNELEIRRSAAQTLGYFGNPTTVPALIRASKDEAPEMRRAGIDALGSIGIFTDPITVSTIIAGLYDPVYEVREAALAAAKKLGDIALPDLIKLLNTKSDFVFVGGLAVGRINALLVLRNFRKIQTSRVLISTLNDDDPNVRGIAADCLGSMKNVRSIPYLEMLLEDKSESWYFGKTMTVKNIAYSALYYMDNQKATQIIIDFNKKVYERSNDNNELES